MGKFVKLQSLKDKKLKKPVVLTGGAFDFLHLGQAEYLKKCKGFGKTLIVQVASDRYVKLKKGRDRPVNTAKHRATLLSYLEFVDYVFVSDKRCESKFVIDIIKPDILILSDENKSEKLNFLKMNLNEKQIKKLNLKFISRVLFADGISTTRIIEKIKNRRS